MNKYRHILLILALTAFGCAGLPTGPAGPAPVSNAVRKEIGRMAVRAPSKPPVTLTADLDNKGKAAGKTAAAAGLGWLDGSFNAAGESGEPFGAALIIALGLVTAPIVATGGAIYGATVADTDEAIADGNKVLEDALDFAPARFNHSLQTVMNDKLPVLYAFVPAGMENGDLDKLGFDSVMDLQMERLQSHPSSNQFEVNFSSHNRVVVTALADGRVLEARYYSRETADRSISSWARNNGEVLLADLDQRFAEMSEEIVEEFFVAPAIRVQGLEPVSSGWGRQGKIGGLMPLFIWSALDGASGTPGTDVSYEILIFTKKNVPDAGARSQAMSYVSPEPLKACESYKWKIRAHYQSFNVPAASAWSPTYRFKTPCER